MTNNLSLEACIPDVFEALRYPHIQTFAELNRLEYLNIQKGYIWLSRQRKYSDFLAERFVKELHKKLFGLVWLSAGEFRHLDASDDSLPRDIEDALVLLLTETGDWISANAYNREELAARFFHRLLKIRPFPVGNARFARIMTDVVLEKVMKVAPIVWDEKVFMGDDGELQYADVLRYAERLDDQMVMAF